MQEVTVNGKVYVLKSALKETSRLSAKPALEKHPYTIGKIWYIETVTKYWIGKLVLVTEQELVLEDAAWIPSTGRFNEFLKGTSSEECEPCGDVPVVIGRGSLCASMPKSGIILAVR